MSTKISVDKGLSPMVSCIMPTYNRRAFLPHAIRYFLRQDYPQKELIIIDDGTDNISDLIPDAENIRYYRLQEKITLGSKLNLACTYAKGSIIANWDDDDWYAGRRLSYQVRELLQSNASVCGINQLLYYDIKNQKAYQYRYPASQRVWLIGSSLCFKRELWVANAFADINVGMDGLFVWAAAPRKVKVLDDSSFSVHMIHDQNISPKKTSGGYWHPAPVETISKIMKEDWGNYISDGFYNQVPDAAGHKAVKAIEKITAQKKIKNIHACLVHENEDCIQDMIRNLKYTDPDSVILLYNGGSNKDLLSRKDFYKKNGVLIHPKPIPQQHGYLHTFALHCMEYALKQIPFDTFTIVDSDQLCIRSNYSAYLGQFINEGSNVGLFSAMPERVLKNNTQNVVAIKAFNEYELWKPLLQSFPDGENKFVYWTFWPTTIFTLNAVRDLVNIFKKNKLLQHIMQHTKIWATEEVIFPTLVKLLGYDIALNPGNSSLVKYKKKYTAAEISNGFKNPETFWIHPVERKFDDPLRVQLREHLNNYHAAGNDSPPDNAAAGISLSRILSGTKKIEGWLDDAEADLLMSAALKACIELPAPHYIVEVGCFQGKSTVLLGKTVRSFFPAAKVIAIDPHNGVVGADGNNLQTLSPTLEKFKKNIADAELAETVELINDYSFNVKWKKPIALLFIDGLHDYMNVCRDFNHFSAWLVSGSYIAFHDYASYFPGVMLLVDELLDSEEYVKIESAKSMMVIQKNK